MYQNKAQNINAVNWLFSYKDQRIIYSIILFIDEYHQIMWVLVFKTISEQSQHLDHVKQRQHFGLVNTTFHFSTFEDKGRLQATIARAESVAARETLLKHTWANLPSIETDWDVAIIDLAYLFTSLVTITQSRLVRRMLQGVEHTDPTGWSSSHLSIGDKFILAVWQTASLSKSCSLFSGQRWFSHSYEDGSATFHIIKCTTHVQKWLSLCTRIMCCFANRLVTYQLYFKDINMT